jgi:signal transduction histidine kinase
LKVKQVHLIAYVLVWSIIPVMTEYCAQGRSDQDPSLGATFVLWSIFLSMIALTGYGFICKNEPLKKTWNAIWNPRRAGRTRFYSRLSFLALSVLTAASYLASVFSFRGGWGEGSPGSATVANLVDSVSSFFMGLVITAVVERSWWRKTAGTRRRAGKFTIGEILIHVWRFLWQERLRVFFLTLTVACCILFILISNRQGTPDWSALAKPAVILALCWSAFATINNQVVRNFARAGIPREDFLFWRFCGPAVLLGIVLLGSTVQQRRLPAFGGEMVIGLVSLVVGSTYAAVLQVTLLKERSVANLNSADLVIPGTTFLLALVLGRTGGPASWLSGPASWLSIIAIAGVLLSRFLLEAIPEKPGKWPGLFRATSASSNKVAGEPMLDISRSLLKWNLVGLLVTVAMFGPAIIKMLSHLHRSEQGLSGSEQGYPVAFLLLFVIASQLIAMTMLANLVREIMRQTALSSLGQEATRLAHDLKKPLYQGCQFLDQIARTESVDSAFVRRRITVDRRLKRGLRLVQAFLDKTKFDAPFDSPCQRKPTDVRSFFDDLVTEFIEDLELGNAHLDINHVNMPYGKSFSLDRDRISVVIENLVDNSVRAFCSVPQNPKTCDGLEIRIIVSLIEEGQALLIEYSDNGPGLWGPKYDANDMWISGPPGGYGLGNLIVERYVKAHKGDVEWPQGHDEDSQEDPDGPRGYRVKIVLREFLGLPV